MFSFPTNYFVPFPPHFFTGFAVFLYLVYVRLCVRVCIYLSIIRLEEFALSHFRLFLD